MLEEPPPRALLSRDVPADCPLWGPTMGLAAALGFPHAFADGAGAAFSVLPYRGGCTTGPIPKELDICGCLGEGPCTCSSHGYFGLALYELLWLSTVHTNLYVCQCCFCRLVAGYAEDVYLTVPVHPEW